MTRLEAGMEVPASILPQILKNQSWKIEEVYNGKQKGKKESEKEEERESGTDSNGEEVQEIGDLVSNRMIKAKEVKKK